MSINTISDVMTRISGIEQQLQQLQNGSLLDSQLGVAGGASATAGATGASNFANQLAAAQAGGPSVGGMPAGASSPLGSSALGSSALGSSALGSSALGSSALGSSALGASAALAGPSAGPLATGGSSLAAALGAVSGTSSLPASAGSQLTAGQQQFASTLSADTGLNPGVVSAWMLAEESGGAAQSRQAAGNNDWLNIGYTDSGTYGSSDSVWSDPVAAAHATAAWLKGQDSIPGYGTASAGIQSILSTVGQAPAAQIQAIQQSGWSSGGYPSLGVLYGQLTRGQGAPGGSL